MQKVDIGKYQIKNNIPEKNMNDDNIIEILDINTLLLQPKKEQTEYKIKYVREYVLYWLKVSANRTNIKNINFIDCMCNAGIYKDGDLCTSIEVLQLFILEAKNHRLLFEERNFE